ncbi:hypothetical protein C1H46_009513 [Malus baccata]|uniref:Uncharacterized protein n=1 Tax=Malus baccata TaxID=106549 RepID=A0A540N308_MALBA|nr:hypothetical protein C1H46_009513 [Malus baccata]
MAKKLLRHFDNNRLPWMLILVLQYHQRLKRGNINGDYLHDQTQVQVMDSYCT